MEVYDLAQEAVINIRGILMILPPENKSCSITKSSEKSVLYSFNSVESVFIFI